MEELFSVRFETNEKSDGHVLDSYIMLYSDSIAQLVEHQTFNLSCTGSSPVRVMPKDCFEVIHGNLGLTTVKGC